MPRRLFAAWALVGVNLLAGADVHAATFEISATTNLANANYVQWNPLQKWGLSTSKSLALDSSETYDVGPYNTGVVDNSLGEYYVHVVSQAQAGAATYGSDTSVGGGQVNPKLLGYAVEPMADAVAHFSKNCQSPYDDHCPDFKEPRADALAIAAVQHRVVQRGSAAVTPETQQILDQLNTIPVLLDVRLSVLFSTSGNYGDEAWARAGFGVLQLGVGTLLEHELCVGTGNKAGCTSFEAGRKSAEFSHEFSMNLKPTTKDRVVTFDIVSLAGVQAGNFGNGCSVCGGQSAYAQAVADPFLRIDPAWDYAQYFMVQQESQLQPGEWVEPTRLWLAPAVPEPATWALMLTGALAWGGLARRRLADG